MANGRADIVVGKLLDTVEWDCPTFHLTMRYYVCSIESESLNLNEHSDTAWMTKESLGYVRWQPADLVLLEKIAKRLLCPPAP